MVIVQRYHSQQQFPPDIQRELSLVGGSVEAGLFKEIGWSDLHGEPGDCYRDRRDWRKLDVGGLKTVNPFVADLGRKWG